MAGNGAIINRFVGVDRNCVVALNRGENLGEGLDGILNIRGARGRRAHRGSIQATENRRNHQNSQHQQGTASLWLHAILAFLISTSIEDLGAI